MWRLVLVDAAFNVRLSQPAPAASSLLWEGARCKTTLKAELEPRTTEGDDEDVFGEIDLQQRIKVNFAHTLSRAFFLTVFAQQ